MKMKCLRQFHVTDFFCIKNVTKDPKIRFYAGRTCFFRVKRAMAGQCCKFKERIAVSCCVWLRERRALQKRGTLAIILCATNSCCPTIFCDTYFKAEVNWETSIPCRCESTTQNSIEPFTANVGALPTPEKHRKLCSAWYTWKWQTGRGKRGSSVSYFKQQSSARILTFVQTSWLSMYS
jgi:hypothetical protein